MASPFFGDGEPTHYDDVVGVEVTIDGMLVIADLLHLVDFPLSLGIRPNIPYEDQRKIVWDQVTRDLTAQGILTAYGDPHPEVAAMVDALSRPDRTLDCRWWRRDLGGKMVRFVVCRKGERHVVAARDDEMLVLQRVAPQIGLAAMVTVVIGEAEPAQVEPLTGIAAKLVEARTAEQIGRYGQPPLSAKIYAEATADPDSWVEITATERHPGGTYSEAGVGAGVLDSGHGRIVSIPRQVGRELYGSFLPGSQENLQRALDGLMQFLPSQAWFDHKNALDNAYSD
ncbi:ESX secretion-associated protein EspG [Mycobacterium sp. 4D054]|uniref:ESX secretion-associated protein EspG n=1 Tax=unclassified Mycobacterium TaxID=2642494 RepID=UPI0021B3D91A|nr:ESX secretion-associated protein EspG [Mycobacterium sp. SMC-8]UXA13705.1 ESX secretion-associated protein EspG [Mycobacterium sp. SMC-8]